MKKRILSVLITLVMLIGMLPTAVSAVETTEAKWAFGTAETAPDDSAYTYSGTLAEAFTAANGNEDTTNTVTYVKLNKDVSMTHTSLATALTLNGGKAMVLDLNSKTYSSTSTSGYNSTYGINTELNSLLTVKNGTISVSSSNDGYAIGIKSNGNLNVLNCTIEASKENANCGAYGISYTGGVATITNCTITATSVGDRAQSIEIGTTTPALTIADCNVNAIGGDQAYAFYASEYWGKMEFNVAGTITATCENGAFYSKPTTNEVTVTAGEDEGTATDADASVAATYANKYVKIEPVKYDLWVGGVQVTSANKDNIVVPGATGSATYDPDTKTLTLDNFNYEGKGYMYSEFLGYGNYAAVYSGMDLTVKLVGTNTVTSSVTDNEIGAAFYVQGVLTITDDTADETDSVLNLTGCNGDGLFGAGVLTIENVTVKATGVGGNGIYCENAVNINNAIVNIVSNNQQALYSYDAITINNSNVTVSSDEHLGVLLLHSAAVMNISNSTVEITAGSEKNAIYKGLVPDFGSAAVIVMAGDDAASATAADATASETYKNRYIKIIPACTVTVNYGVDGVDNKEIAVTKGDTISLENPVIDGYLFMGWFTDTTYQTAFDFTNPITANKTIYAKFADYEGDKTELNNKIDAAKAELQGKIDAVESALAGKADAATLAQAITDLHTTKTSIQTLLEQIDDYEDADTALKTELITKIETADNLINNAISDLTSRVETLESELAAAKSDISTNASKVAQLTADLATLNASLTDLSNELTNDYATKAELTNAINSAKDTINSTIDALTIRVQNLEAGLAEANGKININTTDVGTLKTDVSTLKTWQTEAQNAIEALETLTGTQGTNISALQTAVADLQTAVNTANDKITAAENKIAVLEGKVSALETAKTDLENAVSALQTAVADKADTATVNTAIAELQTAIEALEAVKDDYAAADATLKTELEGKIATAKGEAISAAEALVNNAKADLQSKIDAKADAATVNEAIANLQNAITALEAAKDNYASADAALKLELEDAIAKAKAEAIEASKGYIPHIGTNGNWWIGDTDTGVDANGIKGDTGATGATGAQGPQGEKGDKGDTGAQGAAGVGIAKIEKTSSDGNVDTYTITLTNGTTYTFTVTNGTNGTDGKDGTNGKDGVDGKDGTNGTNGVDGKDGTDGEDGQTPYIGENGNWWIGDTDTGVKAAGEDGKDGAIIAATAVGGTALTSNIALIAWTLIKKKRLF